MEFEFGERLMPRIRCDIRNNLEDRNIVAAHIRSEAGENPTTLNPEPGELNLYASTLNSGVPLAVSSLASIQL
jgi:hypothetical protein